MCMFGGTPSTPDPQPVQAPQVAATPPPPEEIAEAPTINEGSKRKNQADSQRKGTSALRINLNLGGGNMGGGGGTSGLSIPR